MDRSTRLVIFLFDLNRRKITLIPETRRDLQLWKPDRYIKLPVDDWDGPFYVRIKPFTVDDMENALSIVRDGSGNPLIIR